MMVENTTANHSCSNTTTAVPLPYAFLDPAWQVYLTVAFYFKCVVVAVGTFGTVANGLTIFALIAHHVRDAKKRVINLLIINQNVLDLSCCILFTVSIGIEISGINMSGALGYYLCAFFINGGANHCALYGSIINLVALTGERYLKVVHPFWSKKHLKRWVVYAAMAFAWIGGISYAGPVAFVKSRVQNGICLEYYDSLETQLIYGGFAVALFFLLPLVAFVYCYGRIVFVMKRQMRVMAGHMGEGSYQMNASQVQSKRVKWNIIKTMIIVSVAFVISWSPINVLSFYATFVGVTPHLVLSVYPAMILVYINICVNPFIYALKHDGVKQEMVRLINCRKPNAVGDASGNRSSNRAGGTKQARTTGVAHK